MIKYCLCGHSRGNHSVMNSEGLVRFHKLLETYKERNLENWAKFWKKFLTDGSDVEQKCTICKKCGSFKLDNLKLVEDMAKDKGLI